MPSFRARPLASTCCMTSSTGKFSYWVMSSLGVARRASTKGIFFSSAWTVGAEGQNETEWPTWEHRVHFRWVPTKDFLCALLLNLESLNLAADAREEPNNRPACPEGGLGLRAAVEGEGGELGLEL